MIPSELVPILIEQRDRLPPNPRTNLVAHVTRELEVDTPEHAAVAILQRRRRQVRDAPREHPDAVDRHVAAQRHIDLVAAAVPRLLDHGRRGAAERRVRREVVLVVRRRRQQRGPPRVGDVAPAGEVDTWVADGGDRAPAVVEVPGLV